MEKLIQLCEKRGIIVDRTILSNTIALDSLFLDWGSLGKMFLLNRHRSHAKQREELIAFLQKEVA